MGPSSEAVRSIGKSVRALGLAGALAAALAVAALALPWSMPARGALALLAAAVAAALALLASGGRLAERRQRRLEAGEPDLYLLANAPRSEQAVSSGLTPAPAPVRRWLARAAFAHPLLVGDTVRIKPLEAIRGTLDAAGTLGGLPFMKEMERFCGNTAKVYRVVDKIYDYGRSRAMRRLDDVVLLVGLRCDGRAHGGCEAACYLLWNTAWLERLTLAAPSPPTEPGLAPPPPPTQTSEAMRRSQRHGSAMAAPAVPEAAGPAAPPPRYECQYTQLTAASREQPVLSAHGLLGPWAVGNVTWAAFGVAVRTRMFNAFQAWRRGISYPAMPAPGAQQVPSPEPIHAGDWVRVRTSVEIAKTLNRHSKNRGLWFDKDMAKFCGQVFEVRSRVDQIIDITTQHMIPMKTPCIMLENVHFTGEFQGFGEQHDYLYWREAWLEKVAPPGAEKA